MNLLRDNLELNSGLVKFRSKESAAAYMEALLQYHKSKQEEYGYLLGERLRETPGAPKTSEKPDKDPKREKAAQQPAVKGWSKVGSLLVNNSDSQKALSEMTLRIVDDYKSKTEKISEALKSFKDVDTLSQPGTKSYALFIYRGVPEAVIVESLAKREETFTLTASFRAV